MNSFDPQQVLSFDLETTSPNPMEARIVTSAFVTIAGREVSPIELLADPGCEIPEAASKIHGITTEHAREHGQPHDEVLAATVRAISDAWAAGRTLIVFNASYDLTILRRLDPNFVISGPVFDPYVIDKIMDPYRSGKRTLSDMCTEYNVRIDNAHEATSDALAAARIAWRQVRKFPELAQKDLGELMEMQTVGYYKSQLSLKSYLEGKGRDVSDFNLSWPARG